MAEIVKQLDAALRHASHMRNQLNLHPRQSLDYSRMLREILAPYRAAVERYAIVCAEQSGGTAPPEL